MWYAGVSLRLTEAVLHHCTASRQDIECAAAHGSSPGGTRRPKTAAYWAHVTGVRANENLRNCTARSVCVRASRSVIDPAGMSTNSGSVALILRDYS